MKKLVFFVFVTIIAFGASLYFRLGAYKDVEIREGEEGPMRVVSKTHVGAFHKIVPVIEEVEGWAKKNGETCALSFGEYIDNPDLVAEDRLKSNGGCVVEKEWTSGLPEGFTYREWPRRAYLVAEFDGAPSIGPLKVYPKAMETIEEKGLALDGPIVELYQVLSDKAVKTRYLFPVRTK